MRRWIELAAALYPAHWRAEYGEEFQEVVARAPSNWRTLRNVLRGAIAMQMTQGTNWLKWIAVTAALGAALAAVYSFAFQAAKYTSSVTLEMRPAPDPVRPGSPPSRDALSQLLEEEQEIFSRTNLEGIIMDPQLDLYKAERQRIPMEEIVARMRNDIHLQFVPVEGDALKPIRFSISFTYPDPFKAQAVTRSLTGKFTEQNVAVSRNREFMYREFWAEMRRAEDVKTTPPPPPPHAAIGPAATLAVVDPPSMPSRTESARARLVAFGTGAGALLGLLFLIARRKRRGYWVLAAAAAAGLLVGAGVSLLAPDRMTSTALMRVEQPIVMADPMAQPLVVTAADTLARFEPYILTNENLAALIQELDLYKNERRREPLEQVAGRMREHEIQIAPAAALAGAVDRSAFRISFTYSDPQKAQAVVRWLVSQFAERNLTEARERARAMGAAQQRIEELKLGQTMEVLDPPSLPQAPVSPNRPAIAAAGAALGLLVGIIALSRIPMRMTAAQSA